MTIAFVGLGSNTLNSGAATYTITGPTCSVGDMLFVFHGDGGGPETVAITGGAGGTWTERTGSPVGGTTTATGASVFSKAAQSGDSAAVFTLTWSTPTNQKAAGFIAAYSGVDTTTPVNASTITGNIAAATALTLNVTSTVSAWIVAFWTQRDSSVASTYTSTAGSAQTERGDISATGTSQVASSIYDSNGNVASGSLTVNATSTQSLAYSAAVLALNPAAAAATYYPGSRIVNSGRSNFLGMGATFA